MELTRRVDMRCDAHGARRRRPCPCVRLCLHAHAVLHFGWGWRRRRWGTWPRAVSGWDGLTGGKWRGRANACGRHTHRSQGGEAAADSSEQRAQAAHARCGWRRSSSGGAEQWTGGGGAEERSAGQRGLVCWRLAQQQWRCRACSARASCLCCAPVRQSGVQAGREMLWLRPPDRHALRPPVQLRQLKASPVAQGFGCRDWAEATRREAVGAQQHHGCLAASTSGCHTGLQTRPAIACVGFWAVKCHQTPSSTLRDPSPPDAS